MPDEERPTPFVNLELQNCAPTKVDVHAHVASGAFVTLTIGERPWQPTVTWYLRGADSLERTAALLREAADKLDRARALPHYGAMAAEAGASNRSQ